MRREAYLVAAHAWKSQNFHAIDYMRPVSLAAMPYSPDEAHSPNRRACTSSWKLCTHIVSIPDISTRFRLIISPFSDDIVVW